MFGMDSFEFNKIAGAVLGTLLFMMGVGILGEALFSPRHPPLAGYALPEAESAPAASALPPAIPPAIGMALWMCSSTDGSMPA